jgi:hypothetical protein
MSSTALTDPETRNRLNMAAEPIAIVKAIRPTMLPRRQKFFKAVIWAYFEQTECREMHIVAGRSIRAKVVSQPDANELQEPECAARSGSLLGVRPAYEKCTRGRLPFWPRDCESVITFPAPATDGRRRT